MFYGPWRSSLLRLVMVLATSANPHFATHADNPPTTDVLSLSLRAEELRRKDRQAEALPLAQEALAMRRAALGTGHPQTVPDLCFLARICADLGHYAEAETLFEQAMAIRENQGNAAPQDTWDIFADLAAVYRQMAHFGKSDSLFRRALAVAEAGLGRDHPKTAKVLNALGEFRSELFADYGQAESLFARALAIREKALGPEHPDTAITVRNLGTIRLRQGDRIRAKPLFQRALAIREKTLGPEHPDTATSLIDLADAHLKMGAQPQAQHLFQRALAIREKVLGPEHPDTASCLNRLANLHHAIGDIQTARTLYQRVQAIRDAAVDRMPSLPHRWAGEIQRLCNEGEYSRVLPLANDVLDRIEQGLRTNQIDSVLAPLYPVPDCAANASLPIAAPMQSVPSMTPEEARLQATHATHALAHLAHATGKHPEADCLFNGSLMILERVLGPADPRTVQYRACRLSWEKEKDAFWTHTERLHAKAKWLHQEGHPWEALQLGECALKRRLNGMFLAGNRTLGATLELMINIYSAVGDGLAEATTINEWLVQLVSYGEFERALPLSQRALAIFDDLLGPDHPETARSVFWTATLFERLGQVKEAESLARRCLTDQEKRLGPDHLWTAEALNFLAGIYQEEGDYAKAEPLFERALAIREKQLGSNHRHTGDSLNNLAGLCYVLGDYARAEELYERALENREHQPQGPILIETGTTLCQLAKLRCLRGDCTNAAPLVQRAWTNFISNYGTNYGHLYGVGFLGCMGDVYREMGDLAGAEDAYQRGLTMCEKTMGPRHPSTAERRNSLAALYHASGDYGKAEPLYLASLDIYDQTLGAHHPRVGEVCCNLAALYTDTGRETAALDVALKAERADEKRLANILSFTSEHQRMMFQRTCAPYDLLATLGRGPELAQTVLRRKSLVLDSLLEDQVVAEASADPARGATVEKIRTAKRRLTQLLIGVPTNLSDAAHQQREAEKETLAKEIEELEASLARNVAELGHARRTLSVTVPEVQAHLAQGQVLIEFIHYGHGIGNCKREPRYAAVVITPGEAPKCVGLGNAEAVDRNVGHCQKLGHGAPAALTFSSVLHALFQQVWAPIEKILPSNTTTVILSPDGQLNFVSFATLLSPGDEFLGTKYSIRYVSSGRDLLRDKKPSATPTVSIFANPDFGIERQGFPTGKERINNRRVTLAAPEMRAFRGLTLPPLPGTTDEGARLEALATQSGWPTKTFLGTNATEDALEAVCSPRILHLATHGFFLPDEGCVRYELSPDQRGVGGIKPLDGAGSGDGLDAGFHAPVRLNNPMHRSGLALAGAARTLQSWAHGEVPPTASDGIVTAEEVGGLRLHGTWLVVLSACDTGLGQARAGEGVLGLRRGFIQAGAQNLLMTLWAVADDETVRLMTDFYAAAQRTGNAPAALADVQRDWLVRLRKEHGLGAAVRLAGPFIMNSQGQME